MRAEPVGGAGSGGQDSEGERGMGAGIRILAAFLAALAAAAGVACAIAAYVDALRQRDQQTATLGVAMGQPQWPSQPPYPAPVAYPPYGGYGGKQPAGAA